MELGKLGVWTALRAIGEENAGTAAKLAEDLGYGTFWLGGSPQLPSVRPLLEATTTLKVATGIVNIWDYDPAQLAKEHLALTQDFPGRLLLGVGIGHPEATSDYKHPLKAMRTFLDGLAELPREELCVAALGPKMLDLTGERTWGTHPYFVPVAHTTYSRERLGAGKLVAPEVACVVDPDPETARATARKYASLYLGLSNYTRNLLLHGFEEADIADGGSDRLIDTVVPHGTAADIAAVVKEHLAAGADHVCVQPVGVRGVPTAEWTALAEAALA